MEGLEPGVGIQFEPTLQQSTGEVRLVAAEALLHRLETHHGVAVQPVDVGRRKGPVDGVRGWLEIPAHPKVQPSDLPQQGEQVQRQHEGQHRTRNQDEPSGGTRTPGAQEADEEHDQEQTGQVVG